MPSLRSDRIGEHRTALEKNKKRILQSQNICAICGQPVDKSLTFPDPMSPTVDHIIPISRGGHPSDISNLQLAHFTCNRLKSDRLTGEGRADLPQKFGEEIISNRVLPLTIDWKNYKSN